MSAQVHWRRRAQRDVAEAAVLIADGPPTVAGEFLDAVDQTIQSRLEMPRLGKRREFARIQLHGLRSTAVRQFKTWLVFYKELDGGSIEIVRVLHGARDLELLFEAD